MDHQQMLSQLRTPVRPARLRANAERPVFDENELILRSQDGGYIEFQFEELRCKHYNNRIYNEAMRVISADSNMLNVPAPQSKKPTNINDVDLDSLTLSGLYQCCPELRDGTEFEKQILDAETKTVNLQFAMNELAGVMDGTPTLKNIYIGGAVRRPTLQYENTINFDMVKAMKAATGADSGTINNNNTNYNFKSDSKKTDKNVPSNNNIEENNNENEQPDLLFDSLGCN